MNRVGLACASLLATSGCFAPDTTPFGNASLGSASTSDGTADTVGDDPSSTTGGPTTDATADATSSTTAGELTSDDTAVDSSSSGGTAEACGDGMLSGSEDCDDGDADAGDGCSDTCEVELGFSCVGQPSTCTSSCGDGIVATDEDCDDDNEVDGDGCTACAVDRGFQCRGVPSVCSSPCGDGMLDGSEVCDDGGLVDGDGCASDCTVELYYRCVGAGAGSCAPIRIGYVPADSDDATFRDAIAAITGGSVDYSSATAATPTLVMLQASYDCVFTHANSGYADSLAFGNTLAGYVDGGGNVVLGIATDYAPSTGLSTSMIMQDTYSPIGTAGNVTYGPLATYAGDGTTPIHASVVSYTADIFDTAVVLQGAGIQDGTYDNGTIAAAYRPDFKVVYVNGTGNASFLPTGDWPRLVANACAVGFLQAQ